MRTDWSEPAWLPPPMWLIESFCFFPVEGATAAAGLVGSAFPLCGTAAATGLVGSAAGAGSAGLAGAAPAGAAVGAAGVGAPPPQAARMAAAPVRAAALTNRRRLVDRSNDIT